MKELTTIVVRPDGVAKGLEDEIAKRDPFPKA